MPVYTSFYGLKIERNHAQEDQLSLLIDGGLLMMFDFSHINSPPPPCVPCSTAQRESARRSGRAHGAAACVLLLDHPCCLLAAAIGDSVISDISDSVIAIVDG